MTWLKQSDKPVFEDFLWSRPERRTDAGELLIIGGHAYHFAAPIAAYNEALASGAGKIKVVLPDQLKQMLSDLAKDPGIYFAPTNPSGSLSSDALRPILEIAAGSDCVLLAGDLGKSSETVLLAKDLLEHLNSKVVITGDIADQICADPADFIGNDKSVLVLTFRQLQIMSARLKFTEAFTKNDPTDNFAKKLIKLQTGINQNLVIHHNGFFWVASNGQLSGTTDPHDLDETTWRSQLAALLATVWAPVQDVDQAFAALTSACYLYTNDD